ncbi:MAG: ABC transporter permease [Rhodoblastus sp.]
MTLIALQSHALGHVADFGAKFGRFWRVVYAVMLQDMRTRFAGGGYLGFLVAVGWPLAHLVFLVVLRALATVIAPVGDSPAIFYGTGILPYILCFYPGRMMNIVMIQNRAMLGLPEISPMNLVIARALLEILIALMVTLIFFAGAALYGIDFMPNDPILAAQAIAVAIYLGIGIGVFNALFGTLMGQFYQVVYILVMVGLLTTSGAYFPLVYAPDRIKRLLEWNPLYHVVNWLRSAYYMDNTMIDVDRLYLIGVASMFLLLGLLGERLLRGKLLSL